MNRSSYNYSIIRYTHDSTSGECLNVAVVLRGANRDDFEFRLPASLVRVKGAFPDADINGIRSTLCNLEVGLKDFLKSNRESGLSDALAEILPEDDGSLRASKVGVGLTSNLSLSADELMERFVLRCELDFIGADVVENNQGQVQWGQGVTLQIGPSSNDNIWADEPVIELRA
jgi:hypothetical protein